MDSQNQMALPYEDGRTAPACFCRAPLAGPMCTTLESSAL